jgi:hypothetical protein
MKTTKIMSSGIVLLCTCLLAAELQAEEVYVTVDEDGVPEFSDQKLPDSTRIELRETVTFQNPDSQQRVTQKLSPPEMADTPSTYELLITDPPDNTAIRENSGFMILTVSIKPQLLPDHTAELMMDGGKLRNVSRSGPVELTNLDRGTHQFSIRVVDRTGRVVSEGPVTSVSILRAFIRRTN